MKGIIEIEGMEFYAFHGHFAEEQIVGNYFLVDVKIECDCDAAAQSDELNDALDYQMVYRIVKEEMQIKSKLLEHLCKRILDRFYETFPKIIHARIKVKKMNPPMGGKMNSVSVSLSR